MMGILRSMAGMVRVELTSADMSAAFDAISNLGIVFYDTELISDLTARISVNRRDYRVLRQLCEKRGDKIKVDTRSGIYWTAKRLLRRPVLLLGLLFLMLSAVWLPTRVFFIQVEGNSSIPANRILEAAETAGISFGASRREVRSEKVKNALLEAVPELGWAGVNTYGCVAKISVRERSISDIQVQESTVGSIVAVRDGIITECTATKGNLICAVGQAVTAGEVLISGYTDCGIFIQATQAEGEVFAETRRELTALIPQNLIRRAETADEKQKYSLLIGKKRINLWKDSGIWDTTCGRMYEEYYVTLPGGFQLPVALVVETFTFWESSEKVLAQENAEVLLTAFAESYLKAQMVAGSLRSSDVNVRMEENCYCLTGEYVCTEMIGRMQREQIGEYHGESD